MQEGDPNLKKKDKCHFRCTSVPFFDKVISRQIMRPDQRELCPLTNKQPPKVEKELQHSLQY